MNSLISTPYLPTKTISKDNRGKEIASELNAVFSSLGSRKCDLKLEEFKILIKYGWIFDETSTLVNKNASVHKYIEPSKFMTLVKRNLLVEYTTRFDLPRPKYVGLLDGNDFVNNNSDNVNMGLNMPDNDQESLANKTKLQQRKITEKRQLTTSFIEIKMKIHNMLLDKLKDSFKTLFIKKYRRQADDYLAPPLHMMYTMYSKHLSNEVNEFGIFREVIEDCKRKNTTLWKEHPQIYQIPFDVVTEFMDNDHTLINFILENIRSISESLILDKTLSIRENALKINKIIDRKIQDSLTTYETIVGFEFDISLSTFKANEQCDASRRTVTAKQEANLYKNIESTLNNIEARQQKIRNDSIVNMEEEPIKGNQKNELAYTDNIQMNETKQILTEKPKYSSISTEKYIDNRSTSFEKEIQNVFTIEAPQLFQKPDDFANLISNTDPLEHLDLDSFTHDKLHKLLVLIGAIERKNEIKELCHQILETIQNVTSTEIEDYFGKLCFGKDNEHQVYL